MTKTVNEYTFVISAVDQATAALQAVKKQAELLGAPLDKINRQYEHLTSGAGPYGKSLEDLASKMEGVASFTRTRMALPTALFGSYALKQAADFEAATKKVKVLAGYAEDFTAQAKSDMKSLEELARQLGKDLKFGPTDVMLGLGELLSNDPNVAKAKAAIKPVLNLSLAADMNPASSARLVGAMQSAFEKLTPTQSSNLLARLQAISSVKLPEFTETISNVAGQAMLRDEDPTAILAASAVLSRSLIDKSKAGSHLEIFYKKLANTLTSKEQQQALADMGFTEQSIWKKDKDGTKRLRTINDLLPKFEKVMNNPLLSKVFGEDAISTVLVLLKNHQLFLDFQKDLKQQMTKGDADGSAALQAAVGSQGLKGSFEQLKGAVDEFSIALGKSGLLKEVTDIVVEITKIVDSLGKMDARVLSALTNLAAATLAISGALTVVAPFLRFAGAVGIGPGLLGLGSGSAAAAAGMGGTAVAGGVAAGALSFEAAATGVGAAAAMGAMAYLMTKDLGKGNPFIGGPHESMSRQEFSNMLEKGAVQQRADIFQKMIKGEELSPSEMRNAQYYAQGLDARKVAGPQFTKEAFSYYFLQRKMKMGGRLDDADKARLDDLRLQRLAGRDIPDLVKPAEMPKGEVVIDFKNVPPGTEIKKTGMNPAFDLKIEFAKGQVMPGKGQRK
jgi:TP901 family phage tail tape measure protein